MINKKTSRLRRALKQRSKIKQLRVSRLSIHRTSQHIYAQVISEDGTKTVASASTLESSIKSNTKNTGNIVAAIEVGKLIALRVLEAGITKVAFDRSGFKYHGRVKALAEAAHASGLKF